MNHKRRAQRDRRRDPQWAKKAWMRGHYPTRDQRPRTQKFYESFMDRFRAESEYLGKTLASVLNESMKGMIQDKLEQKSFFSQVLMPQGDET